jgi:hypothetical protein
VAPDDWIAAGLVTLAPPDVDRVELGAVALARRGGAWAFADGAVADGEAVRAWLDVLGSYRGRPVAVPAGPPSATVRLGAGAAGARLALWPGDIVRRDDEPIALQLHPSVRAVFAAGAETFADRRVLSFEPFALSQIDIVEPGQPLERAVRGASGESWDLVAPVPLAAAAQVVDDWRQDAATLRADRVVVEPFAPRRTITFVTDPAPGQTETGRHTLELGADCRARRAGAARVYVLPAEACAVLGGHLATRRVFSVAPEDVTAIRVGTARSERHGSTWYGPSGAPLPPGAGGLARGLAEAKDVAGYGALAGTAVTIEAGGATISLHAAGGVYALDGRPVRYVVPAELCPRWPLLCK